ncbi:MAG: peptidoglycan DD-metalloendopeptidase family protein, partial [Woeseia sp.]
VAVLPLGAQATQPTARFNGKPVLVTRQAVAQRDGAPLDGDRINAARDREEWVAVIGIPLDTELGTALVAVDDREISFEVVAHQYREQYLTVAPSYVNPDPVALERIARDSALIAKAIARHSAVAPRSLQLRAPIPGKRSDSFGSRRFFNKEPRSPHRGMDISGATGTPIHAPLAGTVILTGDFYFTGNAVFVDHGAGLISLYAHLDSIAVTSGEPVATGDLLGTVGATGRVTGAHLHFATYLNGTPVDPALLLGQD